MEPAQLLILFLAALLLFLPGISVLWAAGLARGGLGAVRLASAPIVTFGLVYLTAAAVTPVGIPYNLGAFLVLTAVVTGVVRLLRGRERAGGGPLFEDAGRTWVLAGWAVGAVAVAVGLWTWLRGVGNLDNPFQEFDTVVHSLLTAYIARTGEASPWLAFPSDLLTGDFATYFPASLHSLIALLCAFGLDAVPAINAANIVIYGLALPLGVFALGSLLRRGVDAPLVAGFAALAAVVSYRPIFQMMHDAGLLANATTVVLAPGGIALLASLGRESRDAGAGRRDRRRSLRPEPAPVAVAVLAIVGGFTVHPTAAGMIAVGLLAWLVGDALQRAGGWRGLVGAVPNLAVAGFLAGLLLIPVLSSGSDLSGEVGGWPRELPVDRFGGALVTVLAFPTRGNADPEWLRFEVILAVLAMAGAVLAAGRRLFAPALLGWLGWAAFLVLFLMGVERTPIRQFAAVFYNSWSRLDGGYKLFAWLMIGVALSSAVVLAVRVVGALGRVGRSIPAAVPIAAALAVLAVGLGPSLAAYARYNSDALVRRLAAPSYFRVDQDDLAAFEWLGDHVAPDERVMNSANDGSTYAYVYEGVHVVSVQPLVSYAPYFVPLTSDLNRLDTDPQVRELVRELDIRWIYVDYDGPNIHVREGVTGFHGVSWMTIPPGFEGLAELDSLEVAFRAGSVTIYEVVGV